MRAYIVKALKALLFYFEEVDPRLQRVREVVAWAGEIDASGERKRGQALNKLAAEFPEAIRRDLAFMIEQVLQETK
jgi:hypothetical protein